MEIHYYLNLIAMIDEIEFVKSLVSELVDNKNDVQIYKTMDDQGILLTVFVNPSDMGMLIGRQGNCISALRTLVKCIFKKQNKNVYIRVHDPREDKKAERVTKDIDEALEDLEDGL